VSRKTLYVLWIVTSIVALLLTAATLRLAARERSQALLRQTVYLTGGGSVVGLHQEPDRASPVVAALARGSEVTVLNLNTEGGESWYRVQKRDMTPGWVPRAWIRLDPP
jgi:hypothetical protein